MLPMQNVSTFCHCCCCCWTSDCMLLCCSNLTMNHQRGLDTKRHCPIHWLKVLLFLQPFHSLLFQLPFDCLRLEVKFRHIRTQIHTLSIRHEWVAQAWHSKVGLNRPNVYFFYTFAILSAFFLLLVWSFCLLFWFSISSITIKVLRKQKGIKVVSTHVLL